jgi:hypothetical protein
VSFQIGNRLFCNSNGICDTISDTRHDLADDCSDAVGTDAVSHCSLNLCGQFARPILG